MIVHRLLEKVCVFFLEKILGPRMETYPLASQCPGSEIGSVPAVSVSRESSSHPLFTGCRLVSTRSPAPGGDLSAGEMSSHCALCLTSQASGNGAGAEVL